MSSHSASLAPAPTPPAPPVGPGVSSLAMGRTQQRGERVVAVPVQGPGLAAIAGSVRAETVFAFATVGIIGIMVLPLPPLALDLLLSLSISLSLVVFLFSLHIEKPLEFSAFPSLLLVTTLLRLSLNVASTRLILLRGSEGPDAAGSVIKAFGQFVVGGNTVVGIIVFLILVIINFVVITKGAGRIAEVGARFTLDAMPGKQMAIDADLAAGLINERDAQTRRRGIEQEADFFGSMDGASKFVRGDAVAGLIITFVNIIGGFIIGIAQNHMTLASAASTYTILTVGDGLVAQIPALFTSVAAGLVTTRAATGGGLGDTVQRQLFGNRQSTAMAATVLGVMALVPGMPHFAFLVLAGALGFVAWRTPVRAPRALEGEAAAQPVPTPKGAIERAELEAALPIELLELEVGYELVPLVDLDKDGALLHRLTGIRKQLATELGVIVPPIHMHDNLRLRSGEYRILLLGTELGRGEVRVGRLLAMNPSGAPMDVAGQDVVEPAFGLPGRWINTADRQRAELLGYTVVDAATVLATHLGELLQAHAHELLGRREVQELVDLHARENQKVLEELIPGQMSLGGLLKVLKNLLKERVSIRDFRSVLEALADHASETKDTEQLTELVRQRLAKQLTARHAVNGTVPAIVLAPAVESAFRRLQSPGAGAALDPNEVQTLLRAFENATKALVHAETVPAILTAADIRRAVSTFVARHVPGMSVLSFRELDPRITVQTLGVIGAEPARAQARGM